jgi:hypothetical protein
VRAYDVRNGTMEWQDQTLVAPGFGDLATAVALNDRAVYVVGSSGQDFGYSEMVVRSYSAEDGTLLWDDRSHRSITGFPTTAVDVALGRNRLFVAGYSLDDFVIRAYGIWNDGPVESRSNATGLH